MDRPAAMLDWRKQIEAAAQACDWAALAQVDRLVAADLPRLLAEGSWTSADRAAYLRLQATHREALAVVLGARADLGHRLNAINEGREAWLRYAEAQAQENAP